MKLTENQKLIIAIVIFAITGFVIYNTFFSSKSGSGSVNVSSNDTMIVASSSAEIEGQSILDLANKINSAVIDSQLFDSTVFKSLVDFDSPLSPEPIGRPNPFATIGSDAGTVNTTNIATINATSTKK